MYQPCQSTLWRIVTYIMRYIRDNKTLGLKYYADMNDAPVSDLLRQARSKTEDKLMSFWFQLEGFFRHWQKYRSIHYILSRWANWPWHTCFRTSCSIKCIKWVQFSMHCRNGFIVFQYFNELIVEQGSRYSYRGSSYYYIL